MLGGAEERRARGPARTQACGRRPRATAVGVIWGGTGLALGAAFLTILGALSVSDGMPPQLLPFSDTYGAPGSGCTSLALDRMNGNTTAEPCRNSTTAPREALAAADTLARP